MSDWTINAKLADSLHRVLPHPVFMFLRNWASALLTPILFSRRSGHFHSALRSRAVDRNKQPIPWYTYPAIDFLAGKDYQGRRVLEFGAGNSTFWWMRRAAQVVALEGRSEWADLLKPRLTPNVVLHLMSSPQEDLTPLLGGKKFDIIIIDGPDGTGYTRAQAATCILELQLVAEGGAVVLDDSEGSFDTPGNEWQSARQNVEQFRKQGYSRVDFFGHAPGQLQWRCTSIFFKGTSFLFEGREDPRKSGA